jgi:hypothetical protein
MFISPAPSFFTHTHTHTHTHIHTHVHSHTHAQSCTVICLGDFKLRWLLRESLKELPATSRTSLEKAEGFNIFVADRNGHLYTLMRQGSSATLISPSSTSCHNMGWETAGHRTMCCEGQPCWSQLWVTATQDQENGNFQMLMTALHSLWQRMVEVTRIPMCLLSSNLLLHVEDGLQDKDTLDCAWGELRLCSRTRWWTHRARLPIQHKSERR